MSVGVLKFIEPLIGELQRVCIYIMLVRVGRVCACQVSHV